MPTAKQLANLKPIKKGQLSKEESKERGKKGGKASGQRRRELRTFKEILNEQLSNYKNDISLKELITNELIKLIKTGSENIKLKAIEMVRDTIGEKPIDKVETTEAVRKIFITKTDEEEANKKIDDFIKDV